MLIRCHLWLWLSINGRSSTHLFQTFLMEASLSDIALVSVLSNLRSLNIMICSNIDVWNRFLPNYPLQRAATFQDLFTPVGRKAIILVYLINVFYVIIDFFSSRFVVANTTVFTEKSMKGSKHVLMSDCRHSRPCDSRNHSERHLLTLNLPIFNMLQI